MEEIKSEYLVVTLRDHQALIAFPFCFFQKFWEVVKEDIYSLFQDFYARKMDLFRLNFAILTLIPKV
jgi:hypothetical protein